jgi:hypothetical protein
MGETYWGLNTRFEDHLLSLSTPTHAYISDAHNHSYGYFGTATCGVSVWLELAVCWKIRLSNGLELLAWLRTTVRIMTFKLVIKLC